MIQLLPIQEFQPQQLAIIAVVQLKVTFTVIIITTIIYYQHYPLEAAFYIQCTVVVVGAKGGGFGNIGDTKLIILRSGSRMVKQSGCYWD
ncbi:MAG: hypothetical protein EZS28_007718 [Streblomastix strix]|uniref:Uncharacterized protein n=1 Tax=Streblomastix strix TaxID=222440 RepID=A0A5J4WP67_9EUKA|nr:MAG: hypothetical protein EZS28_007718 [Streblomastix strix]